MCVCVCSLSRFFGQSITARQSIDDNEESDAELSSSPSSDVLSLSRSHSKAYDALPLSESETLYDPPSSSLLSSKSPSSASSNASPSLSLSSSSFIKSSLGRRLRSDLGQFVSTHSIDVNHYHDSVILPQHDLLLKLGQSLSASLRNQVKHHETSTRAAKTAITSNASTLNPLHRIAIKMGVSMFLLLVSKQDENSIIEIIAMIRSIIQELPPLSLVDERPTPTKAENGNETTVSNDLAVQIQPLINFIESKANDPSLTIRSSASSLLFHAAMVRGSLSQLLKLALLHANSTYQDDVTREPDLVYLMAYSPIIGNSNAEAAEKPTNEEKEREEKDNSDQSSSSSSSLSAPSSTPKSSSSSSPLSLVPSSSASSSSTTSSSSSSSSSTTLSSSPSSPSSSSSSTNAGSSYNSLESAYMNKMSSLSTIPVHAHSSVLLYHLSRAAAVFAMSSSTSSTIKPILYEPLFIDVKSRSVQLLTDFIEYIPQSISSIERF